MRWGWEKKNPKDNAKMKENKERIPVWLPYHPPFYDMEADCFPMSENTENKPDLP